MRTFAAEQSWLFCQECNDLASYGRPGSGKRAGNLKVAHIRNTYQPHRITGLFRRQRISLAHPNGSDVVVPAPDKNLQIRSTSNCQRPTRDLIAELEECVFGNRIEIMIAINESA